jgi:hypothetical protein
MHIPSQPSSTHPSTPPPPQTNPVAELQLDPESGWPGAKACNQKTWANDCTSLLTASIDGTAVTLTPSVRTAFNEECAPAPGLVIGPGGTQAAVVFPQYPIGLTSTSPDGTFTIDFSLTGSDDPNGNDWSGCILHYKIVKGSFLDPRAGGGAGPAAALALPGTQDRRQSAADAAEEDASPARPSRVRAAAASAAGGPARSALAALLAGAAAVAAAVAL